MFFGIGFWECLLVLMVALLVFSPKQLPEVAETVGRWARGIRRFAEDLKKHEI